MKVDSMKACLTSLAVLFLSSTFVSARERNIHPPYVVKRFDRLRMSADYLRWQKIPWMTDLSDGLAVAKKENRPVLLWGSDDNPLDRC